MIYCHWCDREFYEGETITIRNLFGTEVPYHGGCFVGWAENEEKLREIFGEVADQDVEFFTRNFRAAQVESLSSDSKEKSCAV